MTEAQFPAGARKGLFCLCHGKGRCMFMDPW